MPHEEEKVEREKGPAVVLRSKMGFLGVKTHSFQKYLKVFLH